MLSRLRLRDTGGQGGVESREDQETADREGLLEQKQKLEKKLRMQEQTFLGQKRQSTSTSFHLGKVLYELEEYDDAAKVLESTAERQERVLGLNSKATLKTNELRSYIFVKQRKFTEATQLLQSTAARARTKLGNDDPSTLEMRHVLGGMLLEQRQAREAAEILQDTAYRRQRILGDDHIQTLKSRQVLGLAYMHEGILEDAAEIIEDTIQRRQTVLGKDHVQTLESKHSLGLVLYKQKRYDEAEKAFLQVADSTARVLGIAARETLDSNEKLAKVLCKQGRYVEAENLFQQIVNRRERDFGTEILDILSTKMRLGDALGKQGKYAEAEKAFQQAMGGRERSLGKDHLHTLYSSECLGNTLYMQEKYPEAERLYREAMDGRKTRLGEDHVDALCSKKSLGDALYMQRKYTEAGLMFRQVTDGREISLGRHHMNTLSSKKSLGDTLYMQGKYAEAEVILLKAIDGIEGMFGPDHEYTLAGKDTLILTRSKLQKRGNNDLAFTSKGLPELPEQQKTNPRDSSGESSLTLYSSPALQPVHSPTPSADINHQIISRMTSLFSKPLEDQKSYTDLDISKIAMLLQHSNPQWSLVPRTYIILRTINHLHVLDRFVANNFSDYWLPVTESTLPDILAHDAKVSFVNNQHLVLTKSIDLEKGEDGHHCHYSQNEDPPLKRKQILGTSGFGQIDRVASLISFKEYARKQVPRSLALRGSRSEPMKQFIAELQMLKKVKHHHVVKLTGSYTDSRFISLLMHPVADINLAAYLECANASTYPELRTFFGCLAAALKYLHEQKIQHKDIKPGNILVKQGNVLLTDFGLSFNFTYASGSTTVAV